MTIRKDEDLITKAYLAANKHGHFEFKLASLSSARQLRFRCYDFVKKTKNAAKKDPTHEHLAQIMSGIAISVTEEGMLIFRRKDTEAGMQALEAALASVEGVEEPYIDPIIAESAAKLERLLAEPPKEGTEFVPAKAAQIREELSKPNAEGYVANPYYDRTKQ
jgi:hypothetical protein